jgi:glucose-1-phosphate adenylyltransferase
MTGRPKVLALVQGGGQGGRMDVLTRERAKPALPFAGVYHLIDFALSSLAHSGIPDVWVSVQYQAASLDPYLAGGRPWDLDRTRGGFRRIVPEEGDAPGGQSGFTHGNAEDLLRASDEIAQHAPDLVVVSSADHVFSIDLRDVVDQHRRLGSECTVVTADVSRREAAQNVVVAVDADGGVTGVDVKPERPKGRTVATELFVYSAPVLLETLDALRRELAGAQEDGDDSGLGDFGEHLLPRLVDRGRTHAYAMPGYWRDVGRPEAFLAAHRDVLAGRVDPLTDLQRPVLSRWPERPPAMVRDEAVVRDSLLSPGCDVRGTVVRSVLGPGAVVHAGAVVSDSVVFQDCVVESNAQVRTAIIDEGVVIGRGATVGADASSTSPRNDDIAIVGRDSRIRRSRTLPAGARLEPGTIA